MNFLKCNHHQCDDLFTEASQNLQMHIKTKSAGHNKETTVRVWAAVLIVSQTKQLSVQ